MSPQHDKTILPPSFPSSSARNSDDQTLLPPTNAKGFHVTGDVIDKRYTVISELGRGGMGVVYLVEDSLLGGKFAIKRLLPDLASRPELVEVFKREGANAMRFTSESARFVTMRHVGSDAQSLYLVMDYITDPTLRSVLNNSPDNRLELEFAVQVMVEIGQAMSDLHDLGYVHRDLKPENIFISQSDSQVRIRLVDFGLTKDDSEGTSTSLRGGGSSGYASPEQRKGLPTSVATDYYSFGVIAYELLTGELPTGGDRISDFVDVPMQFEEWIMACLTSRPERRMELLESIDARMNASSTDSSSKTTEPSSNLSTSVKPMVYEAKLELTGIPAGAFVTVDGVNFLGPKSKVVLPSQSHQVEVVVKCDGYNDHQTAILLTAGKTTKLPVSMERKKVVRQHRLAEFPQVGRYIHSMCQIPAGSFQMGGTRYKNEQPIHTVPVSGFWLGAVPITVGIWKEYCNSTGLLLPPAPAWGLLDNHPIVNVSWEDIMGKDGTTGFCAWASEIAGGPLHLPTEAQWEYACRGENPDSEYPWGNRVVYSRLWSSGGKFGAAGITARVSRTNRIYKNTYGITDMIGNVSEWCFDWFDDKWYSDASASNSDPVNKTSAPLRTVNYTDGTKRRLRLRCIRGGAWDDSYPEVFRNAYRAGSPPDDRSSSVGFRLCAGPL